MNSSQNLDIANEIFQRETDIKMLITARLGEHIKQRSLKIEGYSKWDLACELEINAKAIQLWMSGTHSFTLFDIAKIESVLGEKIINL